MALVLAFVLVFSVFVTGGTMAFAASQEELNALKEQRDAISVERAEKQAMVDKLEDEQASILERKKALDQRNSLTVQMMELNEKQIRLYDTMIAEEAAKVDEAVAQENAQLERYRSRVRAMEERGGYNILSLILKAESLYALLTSIDDISEIMESDKQLEQEYIAAREHREEVKAQYEDFRAEFEGKQDKLREEQDALQAELDEACRLIAELQEDIDAHAAELAELDAAWEEANAAVNAVVAELEAERLAAAQAAAAAAAAAGGGGGGGSSGGGAAGNGYFIWPCPGHYYITSRVGYRLHPISNVWKNHNGMDIAANYGDTVVAADGGTVTMARVNGGYGNCVMINHGNGYYTLYGHLNAYAVSEGDTVSQGQTIGYVGSTGNSTGPHLHYEIRQGSDILDPEGFYAGVSFTFAPDAGN